MANMATRARRTVTRSLSTQASKKRHVVILGGGIQGASAAYQLAKRDVAVTLVELEGVGSAASGKAGGFLAGEWGSGSTTALHQISFQMHKELAKELGLETYREISTLSVESGGLRGEEGKGKKMKSWLDGNIESARLLDPNTAQVTPLEITSKLAETAVNLGAKLLIGRAKGIVTKEEEEEEGEEGEGREGGGMQSVSAVRVEVDGKLEEIECSDVLVAMGVWSSLCAPWFGLPKETWPITGIKSTHVIWKEIEAVKSDPAALFCGQEENGTHLEIYPRSNGDMYACGIGGSDYVEDPRRLELGGDCEKPSSVKADLSRVEAASQSAGKLSTLLRSAPDHVGACIRPCPPDALPYMGQVAGFSNAFISAGHNCWGILWGPISGLLMAELILDGRAKTADITPFSPDRYLPRSFKRGGRGRKMGTDPLGEQW